MENLTIRSKESAKLPKGAKILKKTVNTTVEEIENGYIIIKNYDINFEKGGKTDYAYFSKKMYSKENPVEIKQDKMLADNFD